MDLGLSNGHDAVSVTDDKVPRGDGDPTKQDRLPEQAWVGLESADDGIVPGEDGEAALTLLIAVPDASVDEQPDDAARTAWCSARLSPPRQWAGRGGSGKPFAAEYGFDAAWISVAAADSDGITGVVKVDQASRKRTLTIEGPSGWPSRATRSGSQARLSPWAKRLCARSIRRRARHGWLCPLRNPRVHKSCRVRFDQVAHVRGLYHQPSLVRREAGPEMTRSLIAACAALIVMAGCSAADEPTTAIAPSPSAPAATTSTLR